MHTYISLLLAVSAASVSVAQTLKPTDFPALDQRATVRTAWTSRALNGVNVPAIAVQRNNTPNPDWTPDFKRCVSDNDWALTFDDGPGPRTGEVLDALRKNNARATFFVIGSRVLEYPAAVRRIHAEGHTIALHTWSHPGLTTMTNDQIVSELVYTALAVKQVLGVTPKFMRPPYGDIDPRVRAVVQALGLQVVVWNHDTLDTSPTVNVTTYFRSMLGSRDGPITLEHDLFDFSVTSALPALDVAGSSGYNLVEVGTCIQQTQRYDESLWTRLGIDPNNPGVDPSPLPSRNPSPSITGKTGPTSSPRTSATTPSVATTSILSAVGISLFSVVVAIGFFA